MLKSSENPVVAPQASGPAQASDDSLNVSSGMERAESRGILRGGAATWGILASMALGLVAGCDEMQGKKPEERIGKAAAAKIDSYANTADQFKSVTADTNAKNMLTLAEVRSGMKHDEIVNLYNKFYKGTPFDSFQSAQMTLESVTNPNIPSSDKLLETAKNLQARWSVNSAAAVTLALTVYKSNCTPDEVYDHFKVFLSKSAFSGSPEAAADATYETIEYRR